MRPAENKKGSEKLILSTTFPGNIKTQRTATRKARP